MSNTKPALVRGLRTVAQAFAGFILIKWYGADAHSATSLVDGVQANWDEAAGAGIIAGIVAFGWRSLLDPSAVPSGKDADQSS